MSKTSSMLKASIVSSIVAVTMTTVPATAQHAAQKGGAKPPGHPAAATAGKQEFPPFDKVVEGLENHGKNLGGTLEIFIQEIQTSHFEADRDRLGGEFLFLL